METETNETAPRGLEAASAGWASKSFANLTSFGVGRAESIQSELIPSKSYQDLSSFNRVGSFPGAFTPSKSNAARLRDCVNPVELMLLLSEVWDPNPDVPEAFALDSGEGVVHDIDISELLFSSDSICKKLVSFISFQQTDGDAKAAAIDVFTWFCTQPATTKSLFVNIETVCNWALSLAVDKDPDVAFAGIRGVVNLIKHEMYRKKMHQNDMLVQIVDQIDLDAPAGKQTATLVFMVFHTLFLSEGRFKDHEALVQKLKKIDVDLSSASPREQYWRLNCLQAGVILSKDRVELMDSMSSILFSEALHETVEDLLLDEYVDKYLPLLRELNSSGEPLTMDSLLRGPKFVDRVFKRLGSPKSEKVDSLLKLLIAIAKDNPQRMCDKFLDDNWETLEKRLDKGSDKEKALVLDFFTTIANSPDPIEKRSLKTQEHGTQLVQSLLADIDEQKVGILAFIWKHYEDARDAFIEADVVPQMLALYLKPDIEIADDVTAHVKKILCTLLEDRGNAAAEIQDQVTRSLKLIIDWCDAAHTERNVRLVLKILVRASKPTFSPRVMWWLVDDGLQSLNTRMTELTQKSRRCPLVPDFSAILEKMMHSPSGVENDRGFFLRKFVAVVKGIDSCASMNSYEIVSHDWASEFYETEPTEDLSVSPGITFETRSLTALGGLVKKNENDRSGFLHFLLCVLLEGGLRRSSSDDVSSSGIADVLSQMLNAWKCETAASETSQAFLLCIGAVIGAEEYRFQPNHQSHLYGTYASQSQGCSAIGLGNLWSLVIDNGQDLCNDDQARRDVLSFLRHTSAGRHPMY